MVSASRRLTVPMAAITNSLRSASAFWCTAASSSWLNTTCVTPVRSRRVDEDDLAQVAAAVDPSHEHNFLARVGEPKLSAHMSSSEVA